MEKYVYKVTIEPRSQEDDVWESRDEAVAWAVEECLRSCPEAYQGTCQPEEDSDFFIEQVRVS